MKSKKARLARSRREPRSRRVISVTPTLLRPIARSQRTVHRRLRLRSSTANGGRRGSRQAAGADAAAAAAAVSSYCCRNCRTEAAGRADTRCGRDAAAACDDTWRRRARAEFGEESGAWCGCAVAAAAPAPWRPGARCQQATRRACSGRSFRRRAFSAKGAEAGSGVKASHGRGCTGSGSGRGRSVWHAADATAADCLLDGRQVHVGALSMSCITIIA